MGRKTQAELTAWREKIYALHTLRSQAEARLTLKRIWTLCDGKLSTSTIRRHLAWLRDHKYLAH